MLERYFKREGQDFARFERVDQGVAVAAGGGVFRIEPALIIRARVLDGFVRVREARGGLLS